MALIDRLHQDGIGVILDWVPSHFPADEYALGRFDGTHLYEHADPRRASTPTGRACIFNYGRNEVRSFLISQRGVLARPLPRRRAAGRRRGVDALPRLLAEGRRMGPQRARRPREPGRHRLPPSTERDALRALPWRPDHRGGVDRLADGLATHLSRGSGVRLQVGHGLDARHARSTSAGTRSIGAGTTTTSRSAWCTRSPRTSSCRSPMTRSCTARGPCSAECPGTSGSGWPTSGSCSVR